MTGIDIGLFDYDRHNALYYFILNAEEQIYLRYGGRDSKAADTYLDHDSLRIALELGLERHRLYEEGKLAAARRPKRFLPRDVASIDNQVVRRGRCVECHLIADFQTLELEMSGKLDKVRDMFRSPDIKTLGIYLDVPKGLAIGEAEGPAREAGMRKGDLIVALNGTEVLTFGDLQYHYDKVDREAEQVRIAVRRGGEVEELAVDLPPEWWWTNLYHRYWSIEPVLPFAARPLGEIEKLRLGLDPYGFGSRITRIYDRAWPESFEGLKVGDVLYEIDGARKNEWTRSVETHIQLEVTAGESIEVKFLRGEQRLEGRVWTRRQRFRK